ncbi:hypothetical protein SLEP1_g18101 [Rubroshorea leprosula]|uniref:Uncharacterized protein n=1 Tax=Rubroshorea leprosula TaxID=152421 RepID=A0AAV5J409_9ROSI|nr:hypothetical protein SLEP1_g18101 [Rubroshorea leprosula]
MAPIASSIQERFISRLAVTSHRNILPPNATHLSFQSSIQVLGFRAQIVTERKGRSSFLRTAAVRLLVGSVTRTEGLRFALASLP